jgi:carbamoyl-phosphate synthase large subunit
MVWWPNGSMSKRAVVLFINIGRRVELLRNFRRTFECLGIDGRIVSTDIQDSAPGLYFSDAMHLLPHSSAPDFIARLSEVVKREEASLIVPLIDPDLAPLSRGIGELQRAGSRVLVSEIRAIDVCRDKMKFAGFLAAENLPSPRTSATGDVTGFEWPLVVKPRNGSSSQNVFKVQTRNELEFFWKYVPEPIVQEFIAGDEFTVDVFSDWAGTPLAAVPRKRLKVRAGEVSVGRVQRDPEIEALAMEVAARLRTVGPVNVQIIRRAGGNFVTELNPRFGGGTPLSIEAGAPFVEWALAMADGQPLRPAGEIRDGLTMMRFEDSIFRP